MSEFREWFRDRYGYPFNRPTFHRETFPNDHSVKSTFEWTMLYRGVEFSYQRPMRRHEAKGSVAEAYFDD